MSALRPSSGEAPPAADRSGLPIRRLVRRQLLDAIEGIPWEVRGKVLNIVGTVVEAHLPGARLGSLVHIRRDHPADEILAEVVGFRDAERAVLLPYEDLGGVSPGNSLSTQQILDRVTVSDGLLGRVVDPFLRALDGGGEEGPVTGKHGLSMPLEAAPPNPMERQRIEAPLALGVRAMDALLTMGNGQRLGIMAGSGVGKSVLMGMIAKGSEADVNVIGLVGERGREVREFIERDLGPGLERSVVVVATGDQSPLMRVRAAKVTTAIAEYFAHQGRRVLLMMDSVTRVAMAQREIGLAVNEPPTTKGYTPSVFALLPRLLERAGPQPAGSGHISALYTVLMDGDDPNDPIADAARSILDGHIALSRSLASRGHYPAIDIGRSASRVMYDVVEPAHWRMARRARALLGTYEEKRDVIQMGLYQEGADPGLDEAVSLYPRIEAFLRQDIAEQSTLADATERLAQIVGIPEEA